MAGSYSLPSHRRRWRDATRAVPAEPPGRSPGLTVRSYQASCVGRTLCIATREQTSAHAADGVL
jgi:hypothetical protein